MDRKIPEKIKEQLRKENGFVCAHPECQSPYLEYHHFDPTWAEQNHHNPDGIIALCSTHHPKADGGAYTKEQLRGWKDNALDKFIQLKSLIEWRRRDIVLKDISDNFYIDTETVLTHNKDKVIWFTTSSDGYKLLNLNIKDVYGNTILQMTDNEWEIKEKVEDLECPPLGKSISIKFTNGDYVKLKFSDILNDFDWDSVVSKNRGEQSVFTMIDLPVTCFTLEINTQLIQKSALYNRMQNVAIKARTAIRLEDNLPLNLQIIEHHSFAYKFINLDGFSFNNCNFNDVQFIFSGMPCYINPNCKIGRMNIAIEGEAKKLLILINGWFLTNDKLMELGNLFISYVKTEKRDVYFPSKVLKNYGIDFNAIVLYTLLTLRSLYNNWPHNRGFINQLLSDIKVRRF